MSLTVKLSDSIDSRHIQPGDLIEGLATLLLPKQKTISNAKISFTGKIVTEYSEVRVGSAGNTHGPRRHAVERIILFSYETIFFPGSFTVPAQTFEWPFQFQVPRLVECERRSTEYGSINRNLTFANDGLCRIPPTFEWRDSTTAHLFLARVKYKLVAAVDTGNGLFKHTTKQKLPIVISNIANNPPSEMLRPVRNFQMHCHRLLADSVGHLGVDTTPRTAVRFQATLSFPDRIPVPYPYDLAANGETRLIYPDKFQVCITLNQSGANTPQLRLDELPFCFCVRAVKLTLNQIVTVRVSSTPRLVRNVGTKTIASGGQGYSTNDALVTRSEIILPEHSLSDIDVTNDDKQSSRSGFIDINLSKWAQAVSRTLTDLSRRTNTNEQAEGKGKRKSHSIKNTPIESFRSYTVSVKHSVTVEINLSCGEPGKLEQLFPTAIDIPIVLDGSLQIESKIEESEVQASSNEYRHTKEQEALQETSETSNNGSHLRHGIYDEQLPRYEESGEAPPPPP